jgi:hypothetical protein
MPLRGTPSPNPLPLQDPQSTAPRPGGAQESSPGCEPRDSLASRSRSAQSTNGCALSPSGWNGRADGAGGQARRRGAHPDGPGGDPDDGKARPRYPDARPQRPLPRPQRPDVRFPRPGARPERPDARPERPVARPERPVVLPERPDAAIGRVRTRLSVSLLLPAERPGGEAVRERQAQQNQGRTGDWGSLWGGGFPVPRGLSEAASGRVTLRVRTGIGRVRTLKRTQAEGPESPGSLPGCRPVDRQP